MALLGHGKELTPPVVSLSLASSFSGGTGEAAETVSRS
jgi:hypothetical protein